MTEAAPSDRVLPRDDLVALEGYHSPQLDVSVRLNTNESPYRPPDAFVRRWTHELSGLALNRYPDRLATELREALGARLGHPSGRLFCANGSNEVLQTLLLTYGGSGRRVLVFEPTYALHSHIARITGTEVVTAHRTESFGVPADAVDELLANTGASLVLVCTPNNPTGTAESSEALAAIADTAKRRGALCVVDEAYGEFAAESAIDLVADDLPLVVVRTYSKVWSMAAVRLGFCVAPEPVVNELHKVVLPYSLSTPTQIAGCIALDYEAEMRQRVATLVAERQRLFEALREAPGVTPHPSGANFVLVSVDGDGHALWQALVKRGVLVRDFSSWPGVEQCLRITVGTPDENDALLSALASAWEEVRP